MSPPRVSRADIEAKLREIRGEVDTTATAAKPTGMAIAVVAGVALLGAVYLLGRRKGKKRSTVVEIRRV
ncbi:MAG: LPXTG cell wall anchor domain-containing protein [Actinobacteria bacterium]|nr:LPXTG cell wall anchor domain-containing protein [Actinomycetota bacterium]